MSHIHKTATTASSVTGSPSPPGKESPWDITLPWTSTQINPEAITADKIPEVCFQKYIESLRMQVDLHCTGLEKFLRKPDMVTACSSAFKEAMDLSETLIKICRRCHLMPIDQSELKINIRNRLKEEEARIAGANNLKRKNFIQRKCAEIRSNFAHLLKVRFYWLYAGNNGAGNDQSLPFYDQRASQVFVSDLVTETVGLCGSYRTHVGPDDEDYIKKTKDNLLGEEEMGMGNAFDNLKKEIQAAGDELIARNRQNLEWFQTKITSLIALHAMKAEEFVKEKLQEMPLTSKQDIVAFFNQEKHKRFAEITDHVELVAMENSGDLLTTCLDQRTSKMDEKLETCLQFARERAKQFQEYLHTTKARFVDIPEYVASKGKDGHFLGKQSDRLAEIFQQGLDKWIGEWEESAGSKSSSRLNDPGTVHLPSAASTTAKKNKRSVVVSPDITVTITHSPKKRYIK